MQPTEGFSISRRALDVEDYIDILRRHKGWIFGPFLLTLVGSVVGVYLWPDTYDSVATVQIRRQQISETMVTPVSNQDILERIGALSQQVMSRNELMTMMRNLNLYPKERNSQPQEQVMEKMKSAIRFDPLGSVAGARSVPAFRVRFSYPNRFDAQKLVTLLVTNFIDTDTKTRSSSSFQTKTFMEDQVEQTKKRLDDVDSRITAFRTNNAGKLPDQANQNMSQLQAAQASMMYLSNSSSQRGSEKQQLETQIQNQKDKLSQLDREGKVIQNKAQVTKSNKLISLENQVENLRLNLSVLRRQFKDASYQVKQQLNLIEIAEAERDKVAKEEEDARKNEPEAVTPVNLGRERERTEIQANINTLESQVQARNQEIANLERQMKDTQNNMAQINARLQAVPMGDQLWTDLVREQTLARDEYMTASNKLRTASVAVEMDDRSQGEKLELLDSANLPEDPTEPNRPMVISIGAAMGLVLGVVLAGAREMKDTSLKNLKDVRAYTQMPILGSVPLLENDFVVRRRRRIAWLGWTVGCLTAALVMAGAVVYYYASK